METVCDIPDDGLSSLDASMTLNVNGVLHVVEEVYRLIEHADNHAMCLKVQCQIHVPLSVELQSALGELDEEAQGHPESTNHSMEEQYYGTTQGGCII